MKKRLVVVSIPFQRLIKTHLTQKLLDVYLEKAEVLIVAPFAADKAFQSLFNSSSISFYQINDLSLNSKLQRIIHGTLTLVRLHGYWRKNRKILGYYHTTRFTNFGKNGDDKNIRFFKRVFLNLLGYIGYSRRIWEVLRNSFGSRVYPNQFLMNCSDKYKEVILIQSSSWGDQDQQLAWIAYKERWKNIFVPYTTDQLWTNGYLLSHYHKICVQGPAEYEMAKTLHRIQDKTLVKTGSLIRTALKEINHNSKSSHGKIIYAGCSTVFFPMQSQVLGLQSIVEARNKGKIPWLNIVFRPIVESDEEKNYLQREFEDVEDFEIDFPGVSMWGLNVYQHDDPKIGLKKLKEIMNGTEVLITALVSSFVLEAAFLGVPSISFFADHTGVLDKRKTELQFNSEGELRFMESLKVVFSTDQLIDEINLILSDKLIGVNLCRNLITEWDYPNEDLFENLSSAIFG